MFTIIPTRGNAQNSNTSHLDMMVQSLNPSYKYATKKNFDKYISVWYHLAQRLKKGDFWINIVPPNVEFFHNGHYHFRWASKPRIGTEYTYFRGRTKSDYVTVDVSPRSWSPVNVEKVMDSITKMYPKTTISLYSQIQFDVSDNLNIMKDRIRIAFDLTTDFKTQPLEKTNSDTLTSLIIGVKETFIKKHYVAPVIFGGLLLFMLADDEKKKPLPKLPLK